MHKPKQGWPHSDEDITRGITFRAVVSVKSDTFSPLSFLQIIIFVSFYLLCCIVGAIFEGYVERPLTKEL